MTGTELNEEFNELYDKRVQLCKDIEEYVKTSLSKKYLNKYIKIHYPEMESAKYNTTWADVQVGTKDVYMKLSNIETKMRFDEDSLSHLYTDPRSYCKVYFIGDKENGNTIGINKNDKGKVIGKFIDIENRYEHAEPIGYQGYVKYYIEDGSLHIGFYHCKDAKVTISIISEEDYHNVYDNAYKEAIENDRENKLKKFEELKARLGL